MERFEDTAFQMAVQHILWVIGRRSKFWKESSKNQARGAGGQKQMRSIIRSLNDTPEIKLNELREVTECETLILNTDISEAENISFRSPEAICSGRNNTFRAPSATLSSLTSWQ
jgi:ABC-type iron transport system FetAB ATPase subunit